MLKVPHRSILCIFVCMHVCMYVYVCMYVCMYVCACMYVYTYVYACMHACIYIYIYIYIHWASKETYQFFRATRTKIYCIKINNIKTLISYNSPYDAHVKILKITFAIKEKNMLKLLKVTIQKITETARWEPPRKAAYS